MGLGRDYFDDPDPDLNDENNIVKDLLQQILIEMNKIGLYPGCRCGTDDVDPGQCYTCLLMELEDLIDEYI